VAFDITADEDSATIASISQPPDVTPTVTADIPVRTDPVPGDDGSGSASNCGRGNSDDDSDDDDNSSDDDDD
jgi:hypothetical protein